MKDFYVRVTILVTGLCFVETVTTPSRKSSISLNPEYQRNGDLLANWSTIRHVSQNTDAMDRSFYFFRVLFQPHTKKELHIKPPDRTNHRISKVTLGPLAHLHALEILNLSNNAIHSLSLDLPLPPSSHHKRHGGHSHRGLPRLKVLILQRNQLSGTPKGLWKLKSLQSLDLSFNRIVHIGLSDFHGCLQLESIYLKSNKICTIHPEAFKGLKKLQVVDLRSNALTTLVPIVTIALELPHLELSLAGNQWQCGESKDNFQNLTSASWREIWKAVCSMSVENKRPNAETPQIRISRDTHLPRSPPRDLKSLMQSKAERPQAGMDVPLSALGKEAQDSYGDLKRMWPQSPIELRDSQDGQVTDRKDDKPPALELAICLSVFITFVVAFCLGAFARPYIDRLRQQRCSNERPGSDNAYSNKGFHDDIEGAQHVEHQGTDLHQTTHHLNLLENQNPSWVTEPIPHGAVQSEQMLGRNGMDPGRQQSPEQLENSSESRSGDGIVLPSGHVAHPALHDLPNADAQKPISAAQRHRDVLEESHYDTVAQEYSLVDDVMDRSSITGPPGTFPSSVDSGRDELHPSQSRGVVASFSKTLAHANTQEAEESMKKGYPEPLGAMDSQTDSSEEKQVSNSIGGLATQQPSFQEVDAEKRLAHVYSEVLPSDPPSLRPRWGSGHYVTPATEEPVERDAPFDPHYDLVTNYESDSDEGSLFTLSSEGSEDTRSLAEDQASVENGGRSQPLPSRNLGEYKDSVTSAESVEDIMSQRILEKCEAQEAHLRNTLISGPDACVCETNQENDSSSLDPENKSTWPQLPGHKLSHHETLGTYGDKGPQSEAVDGHYSLRDLESPNVDSSPSPPYSDQDLSGPEEDARKEK
ncbi:leucine-rich repeat-containing protein 66 [Mus pahari]|uniref:leucine-rich repeat-containing protein 66 n=1 Tax=Mus pahari TaxID=10093 RepID=UPI000A30B7AA|nr:leucine-rich repeat-containing protein 66 [Mus pahari]XP_029400814.1 leucine-rich repeat-containing protein 66 [Mus pahari]XP_029400815.1 leucine-rich repeat-containing protein 66 [Mus pahari]